jgi:Zn ribbon nucleic-acid-binding protein
MPSVPDKTKKRKTLSRPCPECEELLSIVSHTKFCNGVAYEVRFVECLTCGYREKKNLSGKKSHEVLELNPQEVFRGNGKKRY